MFILQNPSSVTSRCVYHGSCSSKFSRITATLPKYTDLIVQKIDNHEPRNVRRITADHIVQTEITQISDVECRTSSERGCEPTSKFKTHLIDVNLMFVVSNVNCKIVQSLDQSTLCRCIVLVLSDTLNMSESMKWVMRHRDYERHRGYERHDTVSTGNTVTTSDSKQNTHISMTTAWVWSRIQEAEYKK